MTLNFVNSNELIAPMEKQQKSGSSHFYDFENHNEESMLIKE